MIKERFFFLFWSEDFCFCLCMLIIVLIIQRGYGILYFFELHIMITRSSNSMYFNSCTESFLAHRRNSFYGGLVSFSLRRILLLGLGQFFTEKDTFVVFLWIGVAMFLQQFALPWKTKLHVTCPLNVSLIISHVC